MRRLVAVLFVLVVAACVAQPPHHPTPPADLSEQVD